MLLGIMSDSHGHQEPVARALAWFDQQGVEHVIHCGDIGGTSILEHFLGRPCTFVWGNTDLVDSGVCSYLRGLGLPLPPEPPARLVLAGKTILVLHGHEPCFRSALRGSKKADYLLHGHTHQVCDQRVGATRVINPGALHRAFPPTVATLDLRGDVLRFFALTNRGPFMPWTPPAA